jgi:hypothetical protein
MQNFDILTPDNLPELRALLLDYIGDADYSDTFRGECVTAITAIDHALAENAATCGRLKAAMQRFKLAGDQEISSC